MYKAKRVERGTYNYRGFTIQCVGYHHPEHRVCWEGIEESTGEGIARGYTKRDVMWEIDYILDRHGKE